METHHFISCTTIAGLPLQPRMSNYEGTCEMLIPFIHYISTSSGFQISNLHSHDFLFAKSKFLNYNISYIIKYFFQIYLIISPLILQNLEKLIKHGTTFSVTSKVATSLLLLSSAKTAAFGLRAPISLRLQKTSMRRPSLRIFVLCFFSLHIFKHKLILQKTS